MHVRIAGAVVGLLAMAGSASADVKMVTQMSGRMMGRSVSGETITYVKGNRMRTDQVMGGAQLSTIMNVDSGELISINHKNKEAEIWNVVQLSKTMNAAGITADGVDVSITPNSQSKEIAGYKATGYDMRVAVTSAMGGVQGMTMTVTITGPSFLSSAAPGAQDYAAFYAAAAERGFFFGDPRAAKAQPGNAKGMMELYRAMAEKGVPLESQQTVKLSGDGPMADILAKTGGSEITSTVSSISDAPLADDLFAVPAGYKVKRQQ